MLVARLERVHPSEHEAGIVDEAIEAAESVRCFRDNLRARFGVGDIALDRQRLAARGLDLAHKCVSLVRARMITDRDPGSLLGETSGHSSADAGRAARNENIFAGEIGNDEARSGHQGAFLAEVRLQYFGWSSRRSMPHRETPARRTSMPTILTRARPNAQILDSRRCDPI